MAKTRSISKAGRLLLLYMLREHEILGDELSLSLIHISEPTRPY